MNSLKNNIYPVDLTQLMARFWSDLNDLTNNPLSCDDDVITTMTTQKETITLIHTYGEKIE